MTASMEAPLSGLTYQRRLGDILPNGTGKAGAATPAPIRSAIVAKRPRIGETVRLLIRQGVSSPCRQGVTSRCRLTLAVGRGP